MTVYTRSSGWRCGMSFTPRGTRTLMVYGPASEGWPTMTASRTCGGNAGNGFHARSSDSVGLEKALAWLVRSIWRHQLSAQTAGDEEGKHDRSHGYDSRHKASPS